MVKSEYWDEVRGASQALRELHEETTDALAERGRGVRRPKTECSFTTLVWPSAQNATL